MTSNTNLDGFSDAPAPIALGDLDTAGQIGDAAPTPMDVGGAGSVTGDAPAPTPLDQEGSLEGIAEGAPAPADIETTAGGEIESGAPSPQGGPGDVDIGELRAQESAAAVAPSPMTLSELEAMEAG